MIQRSNIVHLDHNRRKVINTNKTLMQQLANNKLDTIADKGISFHLVEWASNT